MFSTINLTFRSLFLFFVFFCSFFYFGIGTFWILYGVTIALVPEAASKKEQYKSVLNDHIKQHFQTGGCSLLHGSSAELGRPDS